MIQNFPCSLAGMLFLLTPYWFVPASAQETERLASVTCDIVDKFGISLLAVADLGTLPKSQRGVVDIRMVNSTGNAFSITDITTGCSCLSPKVKKGRIPPGETTLLSFVLETPAKSGDKGVNVGAKLTLDGGGEIGLRVVYQLASVLDFTSPATIIEIPDVEQSVSFSIPFVITEPIVIDELTVDADASMNSIVFSFGTLNGNNTLRGTIAEDELPEGGLSGRIVLRHQASGQTAECDLILRNPPAVRLSPSVLRFTKEDDADFWTARAMVQLDRRIVDARLLPNAIIDAQIDDRLVRQTYQHLGNGIYRMKFRFPSSTDKPHGVSHEGKMLKITVRVGGESYSSEALVSG